MERRRFLQQSLLFCAVFGSGAVYACGGANRKHVPFVIRQFEDKDLAHFSYAILLDKRLVLIDPARDPQPYYDYAKANGADIIAVIQTHPHADFVSSHQEIAADTKARLYLSRQVGADFAHEPFDQGAILSLTKETRLKAVDTPGHSPDSISIILEYDGKDYAVFTGDALLFGSVGRPDLREYTGEAETNRRKLAHQMFHTVHHVYANLPDEVLVYPAHGAGSLCASGISDVKESTIGEERRNNFAFQLKDPVQFADKLLADQPYIPKYFPYDVALNKKGVQPYTVALDAIPLVTSAEISPGVLIIDAREAAQYRLAHISGAINIPNSPKFSTWLGSIVEPDTPFYVIVHEKKDVQQQLARIAKIGYESAVKGVLLYGDTPGKQFAAFDASVFDSNRGEVVIVDIRSEKEADENPVFENAINIPLPELEERIGTIPTDKPIYVHCASGYRSAIGSSLIKKHRAEATVFDLGDKIKDYAKK